MNLWLDDVRLPPIGWDWVKTVDEAKTALLSGKVEKASLDHDLGACENCWKEYRKQRETGLTHEWDALMPNCEHFGTGYTLICWMEENDIWPPEGVRVHSANPAGAARMRQVVMKKFGKQFHF